MIVPRRSVYRVRRGLGTPPPGSIVNGMVYPSNGGPPVPAQPIYGVEGQEAASSGMTVTCVGYSGIPGIGISVPNSMLSTFKCPSPPAAPANPASAVNPVGGVPPGGLVPAASSGASYSSGSEPVYVSASGGAAAAASASGLSALPWWAWALLAAGGLYFAVK